MTGCKRPERALKHMALATVGLLAAAGFAHADITYPDVTLQFFAAKSSHPLAVYKMHQHSNVATQLSDSVYYFEGGTNGSSNQWELEWSMSVSPALASGNGNTAGGGGGAFINLANLAVTNTTNEYQSFFALVTLSLDNPILSPTFSKGDVAVSVQSYLGQGATLRNISDGMFSGDPIYESLIDGVSTQTLMDAPTQVDSSGFAVASDTAEFGQDLDVITGPALTSIGIWLKIEVSPQSIATVIGIYEVMPVPAPAALPLLALGALVSRRRRRA
jgi:MYXO-CTERM domain-containing protein